MKELKNIKELYYWLEVDLSILRVMFYIVIGNLIGGYWWILFGTLIVSSVKSAFKHLYKSNLIKNENKKF